MISTVHTVVENVTEDGSSTKEWCVRVVDVNTEKSDKLGGGEVGVEGGDLGFEVGERGVGNFTKVFNNYVGLKV